jgi:hypothetical protein
VRAAHEKAVGVLDTPPTADTSKRQSILEPQAIDRKEFDTLRARFARRGYSLQRVYRAADGRVTFHIMRSSKTCVLSHPHDVRAFLTQVEEAQHGL